MTETQPPKTLRQLLDAAISDIEIYKDPDIDEFRERMDPVLKAAGLNQMGGRVARIFEHGGTRPYIEIHTEWSARNCAQTSEICLESAIIDADDPVHAARVWKFGQQLDAARGRCVELMKEMAAAQSKLIELERKGIYG